MFSRGDAKKDAGRKQPSIRVKLKMFYNATMQCYRGNIFLIGLMGAGKTTQGRRLATMLGKTFLDADAELERRLGCTISDIFEKEGETSFRDHEQTLLAELVRREDIVLSTGGGVVLREENREQLRNQGTVIYLHALPAVLSKRLQRATNRPLLRTTENLLAQLEKLYAVRDPLYRETAHDVIESTSEVATCLAATLQKNHTEPAQRQMQR